MAEMYAARPPLVIHGRDRRVGGAENGIIVQVIVDATGKIVDGVHRAKIGRELGIEIPVRVVAGTEAELRALAIALNIFGRHG